jgi:hypothetical protein
LEVKYDEPLANFPFNSKLRRYTKEPLGTLRKTIGTLHAQSCAKDKVIVCLATESRDGDAAEKVKALMVGRCRLTVSNLVLKPPIL